MLALCQIFQSQILLYCSSGNALLPLSFTCQGIGENGCGGMCTAISGSGTGWTS